MQQQVVEGSPLQAQAHQFPLQLAGRCTGRWQQAIHVVPVAQGAWHPPGGGVGLGEQPPQLEGAHGRADRGWARLQPEALNQGFAANRFRGVHVVAHGGLQHLLLPVGQRLHGLGAGGGMAGS